MKILVIDCDYTMDRMNNAVIRIYGKQVGDEKEGEDIVLHVNGFEPYIYIGDCGINIFELKKMVEIVGKGYIKECKITKKYKPIGYQVEKSNFLKLVLFSPKVVRELRELLKENIEEITDSQFFEADVQYRNRYMIDAGINGFDVIEFSNNQIPNYGIQCDRLYICNMKDIRVLKDELVNIEY